MNEKPNLPWTQEEEADQRTARVLAPMRNRGLRKQSTRSSRSSAKRTNRKSSQGGIHQRRNKRSDW